MPARTFALSQIQIAAPCHVQWQSMTGGERVRHCDACSRNVYNFSDMTEEEVVALVTSTEGRLCGAFYRRADGTMLVKDCPRGLAAMRKRLVGVAAQFAAAVLFCFTVVAFALPRRDRTPFDAAHSPISTLERWTNTRPLMPMIAGEIAMPLPTIPSGTSTDPSTGSETCNE